MDPKIEALTEKIRRRSLPAIGRGAAATRVFASLGGPGSEVVRSTERFPRPSTPGVSGDMNSATAFVLQRGPSVPSPRATFVLLAGEAFPELADGVVAAIRLRGNADIATCVRELAAAFDGRPRGRLVIVDRGRAPWKLPAPELDAVRGYGVSILELGDPGLSAFALPHEFAGE